MKIYYKSDGDDNNYPCIIINENRMVNTFWINMCNGEGWSKRTNRDTHMDRFEPKPYRISKAEAESILFLDSI